MEELAKKYIEKLGGSVPIFSILQATRKVYSKLPHGECWLHDYLYTKLQAAFALDESTFKCDEFYCSFGEDHLLDRAVMRMLINIYTDKISSLHSLEDQKGLNEQMTDHNGELNGLHAAKNSDAEIFIEQQPEQCAVKADEQPVEPCSVKADEQPVELCAVEADEQPVEPCAVKANEQPVEQCTVPMLLEDIGLYINWTNLEIKGRKRRKKILKHKGLLIPGLDVAILW